MTDIRENLGYLIGSFVTALALVLGLIYQSGVLNTLVGVAIGAGITYYVQTRTQNRAWKREYAVKIAETVYGSLFKQIKSIIGNLEQKYHIYYVDFSQWREFQEDQRYFMVDESFRSRLDDFTHKLEEYSQAAVKLEREISKIIMEETERVYGIKTNQIPQVQITYMRAGSHASTNTDLLRCLVSETHPIDFPKTYDPEATDIAFTLIIISIDNIVTSIDNTKIIRVAPPTENKQINIPDSDRLWQVCLRRMKENETYKLVTEENGKILEDAQELKKELSKRIEEPWRI
jgi:hypothetical protein